MRTQLNTQLNTQLRTQLGTHHAKPKRGFVLLMVLVAIIVVGVAMTTSARRSLQASLAAAEEHRSLQRRWGMLSCQRTLLPAAASIFEVSDLNTRRERNRERGSQRAFPSILESRIQLGGQTFDLLLADEDAKANLNAIYDAGGERECEQAIRRLTGPMESRTARLMPTRKSQSTLATQQAKRTDLQSTDQTTKTNNSSENLGLSFRSWGEVFDLVQLNRLAGEDRQLAKMTRNLSLHGSGRLNVFRAPDETLLAVCGAVVQDGLARRVLANLRETSLGEIGLILERTVTNAEDRNALRTMLGATSSSFSIWIEATDGNSRQQRLAIQALNEIGAVQTIEFSFE